MNNNVDILMKYLPLFIPLIILELALMVTALIHVLRHPHYRFGNKVMWIIIVVFIQIIGPIVYFVFGRGEDN
ncbi:MAG: PLDc N-terminal domain-containing protein [Schleiferilactobacillus harbinensis]|nr:PLDc N-terminal domain-containing protein [Schleiferilactobacillus harbinensis]